MLVNDYLSRYISIKDILPVTHKLYLLTLCYECICFIQTL